MTTACETDNADGGWWPVRTNALLMVLWFCAYSGFTKSAARAPFAVKARCLDGDGELEGLPLGTASWGLPEPGKFPPEGRAKFNVL